jgi:hypothetical protein
MQVHPAPPRSRPSRGTGIRNARRPSALAELLTLSEAGKRFGVSERRVYQWAEQGLLHPVKPHGRILYPEWELRCLVERET